MSLPRIAVVGSCVSRDPFNRLFAPGYKDKAEVVETVYQSAIPSLARQAAFNIELPETVRPHFRTVLERESDGRNLARLATANADIVVFDFFADVHFGITPVDGVVTTRNHMAFQRPSDADDFFDDRDRMPPERMRFVTDPLADNSYRELSMQAMNTILEALRGGRREPLIVVNAARMSLVKDSDGVGEFDNAARLAEKNQNWQSIEDQFADLSGATRIEYPPELFVGSHQHPWGLHPVHYTQPYYDHFWKSLDRVIDQNL